MLLYHLVINFPGCPTLLLLNLVIFVSMKALVITPKNQSEFKFLSDLLKKLDIMSVQMNEEEIEDLGLSKMLKSVDKTDKVSKESILAKLSS